ncbi:MAG: AMP-binding protein [Lachnospiraceae bacterium]|nr:AMP-binding protein [Lachnospiraceae bacterium]
MIIERTQTENGITLSISGRIDTTTSPELREEIAKVPDDTARLVLDFKDVAYISSAGLREILICRKRFPEDRMLVTNVSSEVNEIFEVTGFDELIPLSLASGDVATYVNLSFASFLERKVQENGDKVTIVAAGGAGFTWNDIDIASQIIASDLSKAGVTKGTHVGICALNSINWVLTFYAVQKLGGIALLINPGQRAEEIARVAKIGGITHLCYGEMPEMKDEESFLAEIRNSPDCPLKEYYSIRNDKDIRKRFEEYDAIADKFRQSIEADDPCAMIFTSGSTGVPKGVLLSAYNILNAASANYKDQTLNEDDKTCLILPLFHIFGLVAGLFANAMAGSVIYIPKDIRTDTLLELMAKEKCTIFHSVPTMLIALMNNKNFEPEKFSSLRCTIISGAAATQAQIEMFQKKLPNDHFLASYGLSEMAPVSITPYGDTDEHVLHTVGKPVANINIKIQNMETKEDCAIGESGEILVQGFNLMIGYYKVPIDQQSIDDEGWLHTGDIGCLDEEGYLRLSGRLKELIIRGGENIMPGEVEAAISELEIVDNVKVFGVPSEFFGEEVGACIKLKDGAAFDEESMKAELKKRLAKFKIPAYFVIYDEFPMLGTGKIDGVTLKADAIRRIDGKKD